MTDRLARLAVELMTDTIYDGRRHLGFGMNATEIMVGFKNGFVEVTLSGDNGEFRILMELDNAQRFFKDVHAQLGEP